MVATAPRSRLAGAVVLQNPRGERRPEGFLFLLMCIRRGGISLSSRARARQPQNANRPAESRNGIPSPPRPDISPKPVVVSGPVSGYRRSAITPSRQPHLSARTARACFPAMTAMCRSKLFGGIGRRLYGEWAMGTRYARPQHHTVGQRPSLHLIDLFQHPHHLFQARIDHPDVFRLGNRVRTLQRLRQ